jgi:hypothetical protein
VSSPVVNPEAPGCPSWERLGSALAGQQVTLRTDTAEWPALTGTFVGWRVDTDRDLFRVSDHLTHADVGCDTVLSIEVHSAARPEHAECKRGTPGCSVHHLASESCQPW